jgi:hypothetical protein
MSRLLDFYRGQARDEDNRLLADLWAWSDADLEEVHDYIQWMFPLPEPSRFNLDAPLLTDDDIAAFRDDLSDGTAERLASAVAPLCVMGRRIPARPIPL